MANAIIFNLFRSSKFQDAQDASIVMDVDATVELNPNYNAVLTQNPVENGANVNDHVKLDPIKLSVKGVVSQTPVGFAREIPDVNKTTPSSRQFPTLGNIALFFGDRAQQAHDYLEFLWKSRNPFNFVSRLRLYENMIITNLQFPRNSNTGDALEFVCQMQQVTLIESQTVALTGIDSINDQSSASVEDGKKQTKALNSKNDEKASILFSLFGQ
jgi:hypothetical protein